MGLRKTDLLGETTLNASAAANGLCLREKRVVIGHIGG